LRNRKEKSLLNKGREVQNIYFKTKCLSNCGLNRKGVLLTKGLPRCSQGLQTTISPVCSQQMKKKMEIFFSPLSSIRQRSDILNKPQYTDTISLTDRSFTLKIAAISFLY